MDLHKLNDDLTVAGQIDPAEIPLLAAQGIRSIICNRPDGEVPGQPPFSAVRQAAAEAGIRTLHLPVVSNAIGEEDVTSFGKALDELPKPILAYCRSGTRSAVLWSLSEAAGGRSIQDILSKAAQAGYDLSALSPRLEKMQRP
jgi:sulfide:quinone oxidoreductase